MTEPASQRREPWKSSMKIWFRHWTLSDRALKRELMFLPQLLMSAEAAKAGFEAIKEYVASQGVAQEKKGTIVIATVKGDIHDIGKNIVKVLLENYGYDVIDLGKDVPPETVVEAVKESHAPLVGFECINDHNRRKHGRDDQTASQGSTGMQDNGRRCGTRRRNMRI